MAIITLTTDFGADSHYVAQMKAAILRNNPTATIVDVTHSIPPQDVLAGAVVLADTAFAFPEETVHVAVVDPGVGTDRRILSARIDRHWFVAPDNGLLTDVLDSRSLSSLREVANRDLWCSEVSYTFHGRDIMAPVAAYLSLGNAEEQIGPTLDAALKLDWPPPTIQSQRLTGEIVLVDSFGNLITNITHRHFEQWAVVGPITVQCGGHVVCGLVQTYGQRETGELVALFGSSGRLELAVVGGSAAATVGAGRGDVLVVSSAADAH